MIILGEGAHFGGGLGGVIANDLAYHQGIGDAVGQMVEGAQLVGHRMADTQKGIGKGHPRYGGGIGHLFSGLGIGFAVFIGSGQVFKDDLQCLKRQTIGVVGGQHGSIGLNGMGQGVNPRCGGEPLGHLHHQVGIHDGHVGQELIVGQRILNARLFIGDNRKGGYL